MTRREHVATWAVQDFDRRRPDPVSARGGRGADVGPWKAYLDIRQRLETQGTYQEVSNVAKRIDRAGNRYEEFAMSDDEFIRVTFILNQDWARGPTLRVQKRAFTGRLSQGPEFPAVLVGELARALHTVRDS
jgi:hypothetical protein